MAKKNIYPVNWQYELPENVLSTLDEYHILKVPLLGQHYKDGPWDWCGRTSSTMAYNYYQVVQGGEFTSRFITHWDGGKPGQFVDLRYPGGQRAFHTKPTQAPHNINLDKYAISNPSYDKGDVAQVVPPSKFDEGGDFSASRVLGFSYGQVLPYTEPDRKALAAQIANDPRQIEARLATILKAIINNNPVIFYSGFSATHTAPVHLILIIGYAYLVDSTGRHLWLVVADPSTQGKKVGDKKGANLLFPPNPDKNGHDLKAFLGKQISGDHDLIRLIPGNWDNAEASLVLIRARKLFEENLHSTVRDDLFMDYCNATAKGGTFIYSHRQTPVPPELVYTNVMRSVAYPFDGAKERFRPANCYALTEQSAAGLFPLGRRRNLHSGIHLEVSPFVLPPPPPAPPAQEKKAEAQAKKGPEKGQKGQAPAKSPEVKAPPPPPSTPRTGEREVRCFAPGYVVAVRLTNALPEPIKEAKKPQPQQEQAQASNGEQAQKEEVNPNDLAREFTGNHNSFILVRHDVEEVLQKDVEEQPKRFTFYSLYMHLAPPDWTSAGTYRDVGWLKTLARRHGCLIVLDSRNESFRKIRWLQEPPADAASSPEKEAIVPKNKGTFSVIGSGLGMPEEFQLGNDDVDYVRALWKKPERDLTELHKALCQGKIVTLRHPYLQLAAGDLVGYVDQKNPGVGDGFLHWEILGPSGQGQLKDFLDFAEQKLGQKGLFKLFSEEDQNNFFDPPAVGSDELGSLMEFAPLSKRAGKEETASVKSFQDTYDHEKLKEALKSSRALAFSADDTQGAAQDSGAPQEEESAEPTYPVEILISNYKNALPLPDASAPYQLKITFEPDTLPPLFVKYDGRQTRIPIRLPAKARRIFVEPEASDKLLLQTGGGVKDALQRDIEHFKRLASVRWRSVVLRHLNEWMPDSIVTQVMEHLEVHKELGVGDSILEISDKEGAKTLLGKYADAVGWWAHKEEVPFLGPREGTNQQKKLFADSPDADQLPSKGLIDNPHPVTFAWLLMLMSRHNLIRFVETPLWSSEEMKELIAAGWLPAREAHPPRRVGDLVYVGAVPRGSGKEPVTVHAMFGGKKLRIASGTCTDGAFVEPAEVPGWGVWTLDTAGGQRIGSLELEGLRPSLLGGREVPAAPGSEAADSLFAPESRKDGTFSWRIPFRKNCPKLLRGWIVMRTWRQPTKRDKNAPLPYPKFTLADVAIPVQGREDTAFNESSGLAVVDGYIQKGSLKDVSTYVTQHFTYKAFLDAANKPPDKPPAKTQKAPAAAPAPQAPAPQIPGAAAPAPQAPAAPPAAPADPGPKLAWELAEAVERIQCEYSPKQLLSLAALSEDGLSIQLKGSDPKRLHDAVDKMMTNGWLESYIEESPKVYRVVVRPPEQSKLPGDIVLEFDANEAFTRLRQGVPETEEVHVQFGCLFPNGGGALDERLLPTETLGTRCEPVSLDELKGKAAFGHLELWSSTVAEVLHAPRFEAPTVSVTEKGIRISARLVGGNADFWKAVGPMIKVGVIELDENAKKQSQVEKDCVVRTFSFSDEKVKDRAFQLSVEAHDKRAPWGPERIHVQTVEGPAYSMRRRGKLETRLKATDRFILEVALHTTAVGLNRGFKLELIDPNARPPEPKPKGKGKDTPPSKWKKTTIRYKPDKGGHGVTDVEGVFHAEVDLNDVAAALEDGGKEYHLRVLPEKPEDKDLVPREPVKLFIPEPLEQQKVEDERLFPDMWDVPGGSIPMKGERV